MGGGGGEISNLSTTLSVVTDFSEYARNMVGERTFSVVGTFGQCSENAPLRPCQGGVPGRLSEF